VYTLLSQVSNVQSHGFDPLDGHLIFIFIPFHISCLLHVGNRVLHVVNHVFFTSFNSVFYTMLNTLFRQLFDTIWKK
jgi:hypothetical protein